MGRSATAYDQLWGVVSGAVADAFNRHQDYLTPKGRKSAHTSIVKRVTGTVLSFAVQAAGVAQAADTEVGRLPTSDLDGDGIVMSPSADGASLVIRTHSHAYVEDRCYHAMRRALFPRLTRELRRDAKAFIRKSADVRRNLHCELADTGNADIQAAIEATRSISRGSMKMRT